MLLFQHFLKSELLLWIEVGHVFGDFLRLFRESLFLQRKDDSVSVLNDSKGVYLFVELQVSAFLWISGFSWEQDEFVEILFESLDVFLERLVRLVGSSGVDVDSNGSGEKLAESNSFDFLQSESSSESYLAGISLSGLVDDGLQLVQRSWVDLCGSLLSLLESLKFLCWLVEESSDQRSWVLSEVWSLDGVVMSWHRFIKFCFYIFRDLLLRIY